LCAARPRLRHWLLASLSLLGPAWSVGFSEMTSWILCTSIRETGGDGFLKRRDDRLLDLGGGDL
jgi:hypothetical protein